MWVVVYTDMMETFTLRGTDRSFTTPPEVYGPFESEEAARAWAAGVDPKREAHPVEVTDRYGWTAYAP